ncbi:MAG: GvpL/GvpF family gas vesicle protein, partial [Bacteroidota bacterium]
MSLIYIYGIVKKGMPAKVVSAGNLAAAYEEVSEEDFGQHAIEQNLRNMDWVNEKVLNHQNKLNALSKQQTVIPLKFGSIFHSKDGVKKMLQERKNEFEALLKHFDQKKEWGLKLFYTPPILKDWITNNRVPDRLFPPTNDGPNS